MEDDKLVSFYGITATTFLFMTTEEEVRKLCSRRASLTCRDPQAIDQEFRSLIREKARSSPQLLHCSKWLLECFSRGLLLPKDFTECIGDIYRWVANCKDAALITLLAKILCRLFESWRADGAIENRQQESSADSRGHSASDGRSDVQSEQKFLRRNAVLCGFDFAVIRARWDRMECVRRRRGDHSTLFLEQYVFLPALFRSLLNGHHSGRNGFQSPAIINRLSGDAYKGPNARVQERSHSRETVFEPLSRAGGGFPPDSAGTAGDDERCAVDRLYFGALLC